VRKISGRSPAEISGAVGPGNPGEATAPQPQQLNRRNMFPLVWGSGRRSTSHQPNRPNENRNSLRFPLSLKVHYRSKGGQEGTGILCNMGSYGVLFQCGVLFARGEQIQISIEWPYLLDGSCPLQLCLNGRILRSSESGTAVLILKHVFRTARRPVQAEPAAPKP
jgi:hypothetical protein